MTTEPAIDLRWFWRAKFWFDHCLIWCGGHDEPELDGVTYCPGPTWPPVTGRTPPSCGPPRDSEVDVYVRADEGVVYVGIASENDPGMTPDQTREVMGHLAEAATWVEQHRGDPLHGATPAAEVEAYNLKLEAYEAEAYRNKH